MSSPPVTVVITRRIKPGHVTAFEDAVRRWVPTATQFPGHLGVVMLTPPPGHSEYGAVLKFRSAEDWRAFRSWPEYESFLKSLEPMMAGEAQFEEMHGLEAWFPVPGVHGRPPRWKMATVTLLGVSMTSYPLGQLVRPLMESWPFLVSFLAMNACVVGGLTWIVMPVLTKVFHRWLNPE